ncbi:MAG: hypothetical protein GVY35_00050 [Bacteroidetes bacterium]|jgi:uncharacterized membrane-anchored protein|nr:hypothetical protein [Bacteroidota bacterium]
MLTWFRNQTPLFKAGFSFIAALCAGLILHSLGVWLTSISFQDGLFNLLILSIMAGIANYFAAKHPSEVAATLTPLQNGLLALVVLWSGILLTMLLVWAMGWAAGDLNGLIQMTALFTVASVLLAAFAYGVARRAKTQQRDERNPETGNAPSG